MEQQGLPRHLAAIKRFLLLGQGDFVRVLLDAAQPELDKSAREVSQYTLQVGGRAGGWGGKERHGRCRLGAAYCCRCLAQCCGGCSIAPSPPPPRRRAPQGHLDAALRAAAASEDPDVLRRVDVRLPPGKALEGDQGWDVFSLQYHVDGPLGAVLSPDAMAGVYRGWGGGGGGGMSGIGGAGLLLPCGEHGSSWAFPCLSHPLPAAPLHPQATCASSACCGPSST
jgi:hypothetical protein